MDEETLDDACKNRPAQLAAIKRNANTLTCPIREVKLYEVPTYKTGDETEKHIEKQSKRAMEQEEHIKAAKKTKPERVPNENKPPKPQKPLSDGTKTRIQKAKDAAGKALEAAEELADKLKADEQMKKFVPQIQWRPCCRRRRASTSRWRQTSRRQLQRQCRRRMTSAMSSSRCASKSSRSTTSTPSRRSDESAWGRLSSRGFVPCC